jgi:hypothetical protein
MSAGHTSGGLRVESDVMKFARIFTLKITLLGAMTVPLLFVSAWSQQEVDPSWYDPWAAANQPAVQSARKADQKSLKKAAAAADHMTTHQSKTKTLQAKAGKNEKIKSSRQPEPNQDTPIASR